MPDNQAVVVAPAALADFYVAVFAKQGVPEGDGRRVADNLVQADLRGIETHGAVRVRPYVERLKAGGMRPRTETSVLSDGGATALLDGQDGVGQVIATRAMQLTIERAQQHGIACVGTRRGNHIGALSYYSRMALPHDLIGIAASGTAPLMAPWGGLSRLLTTGPWSIAIPAGEEFPIVVDFANNALNLNKVRLLARRGEKLAPGMALDAQGNPTQDPVEALKGFVLPIGGHKGYGIVLAIEVLTSLLTGAASSTDVPDINDVAKPQNIGHLMLAIRIDRFMPVDEFKSRVDGLIRSLHASTSAPGVERVYVPGEIEELLSRCRQADGIPLSPATVEALEGVGKELGVAVPW